MVHTLENPARTATPALVLKFATFRSNDRKGLLIKLVLIQLVCSL